MANNKCPDSDAQVKTSLEIVKRLDAYIISTNTKCTIAMSYCAAVIALISISTSRQVSDLPEGYLKWGLIVMVLIVVLSAIFAMYKAVTIIFPATFSSVERAVGESVFFYGDIVATSGGAGGYAAKLKAMNSEALQEDLSQQIFTLAKIANDKFNSYKTLSLCLIYFNFLPLAAVVCVTVAMILSRTAV
nr:Pycsar system effector family protein [uncultured Pseudomonas sp.]